MPGIEINCKKRSTDLKIALILVVNLTFEAAMKLAETVSGCTGIC